MKAIVDCNNFYCSCERLFQPKFEGKPVVVLSNNDGCIVSRTDEAKKLGVGIVTTAQKKGIVEQEHLDTAVNSMLTLNKPGAEFGKFKYVNAMTDVTGFGLLGHLAEVCEGSGLSAEVHFDDVPKFGFLDRYLDAQSVPGGTRRNLDSYGHKITGGDDRVRCILADPQTSGGLLVSVDPGMEDDFEQFCSGIGLELKPLGRLMEKSDSVIRVI